MVLWYDPGLAGREKTTLSSKERRRIFEGLPIPARGEGGPRRICIASVDIAGPYHCGGVGAAYHGLALALAEAGHEVTVLYLHQAFHQGSPGEWREYYRARGITFVHHPQPVPELIWYGQRKEASLACYQWLKRHQPFDVIHFHEWLGLPYYTLLAKRQGLAFAGATLCVGTHGPMRWSRFGEQVFATRREDLVVDFMERKSVELADVVVSPSRFLLDWLVEDRWSLPEATYVEQNILAPVTPDPPMSDDREGRPVRELVFFGRLDANKGVPAFCDAVDRLGQTAIGPLPEPLRVTFLGSDALIDGHWSSSYIRSRANLWRGARFDDDTPRVLTGKGRTEALEYLRGEGRLAVIPSRVDNSPCTVQECIMAGIPFLASGAGGMPELIHPEDRAGVICPPEAQPLAVRLAEILRHGQLPARPAMPFASTRERWCRWHACMPRCFGVTRPAIAGEPPLISICLAHYQRPRLLVEMIRSIRAQTYPHVEVIVVDDGSGDEESRAVLEDLERDFAARGGCLLRQPNQGPGVARRLAAERARGSHLLFLDDDDSLVPRALETFAQVLRRTGADALVCVYMEFSGDGAPGPDTEVERWFVPLGPALAAGLIFPELGGTIYLIERNVYFEVGGHAVDRDVDEDWELLVSVLTRGHDLQVIPEPLLWYRQQKESRSRADNRFQRNRSRVELYEQLLPVDLRDLAPLAYGRLAHVQDAGSQRRLDRVVATLEKIQTRRRRAERGR